MSWPPVTKNVPFKEVETAASLLADVMAKDKFQDPFSYLGKKVSINFCSSLLESKLGRVSRVAITTRKNL